MLTTPQQALSLYQGAADSWRALRATRDDRQQQLAALIQADVKPADYGERLDALRDWLDVLAWQINGAAREALYAHRLVPEACVEASLDTFMAAHGAELTAALAPYLTGTLGAEAAMRALRLAVLREAETRTPQADAAYQPVLDKAGPAPEAQVLADCAAGYTPAQHLRYQQRLAKLTTRPETR